MTGDSRWLCSAPWAWVLLGVVSCSGRSPVGGDGARDFGRESLVYDLPVWDGRLHDASGDTGCIPEGEYLYDPAREKCCHNLLPVRDKVAFWKGQCSEPMAQFICTACGDRYCRTQESLCNCPADCTCYGEADQFENIGGGDPDQKCCNGLKAVKTESPTSAGGCASTSCDDCYTCVKCGDGVCGPGEDKCTCFVDCM